MGLYCVLNVKIRIYAIYKIVIDMKSIRISIRLLQVQYVALQRIQIKLKYFCLTVFLFVVRVVPDDGLYLFLKSATILDNFSRSESV